MVHSRMRTRVVRVGVAVGGLAAGAALVAGPATGLVGHGDGQPPPGDKGSQTSDFQPARGDQPKGSGPQTTDFVPVDDQPVNTEPKPAMGAGVPHVVDPNDHGGPAPAHPAPDLGAPVDQPSSE